jgi:hypothetical protein
MSTGAILAAPFYAKQRQPWTTRTRDRLRLRDVHFEGPEGFLFAAFSQRQAETRLSPLVELVLRSHPGHLRITNLTDQGRGHHQRGAVTTGQAWFTAGRLGDSLAQEGQVLNHTGNSGQL